MHDSGTRGVSSWQTRPPHATTLEVTKGEILSQSPTDATSFAWALTKETMHLPLGCLQGGCRGEMVGSDRGVTVEVELGEQGLQLLLRNGASSRVVGVP